MKRWRIVGVVLNRSKNPMSPRQRRRYAEGPFRRNAADGDRNALSPAEYHPARTRAQELSVSAARDGDHTPGPGSGDGHHLHPDGARLHLARGGARLVQPPGAVVARLDHG